MPANGWRAAALRAVGRMALLVFALTELITWQSPIERAAGPTSGSTRVGVHRNDR